VKRLGLVLALLVFATNAPADGWHFEMADESRWVGWSCSLVLDENEYPHIAYYDVWGDDNYGFRYVHWDGSEWQVEVLQEWGGKNHVGGVGIEFDSAGRLNIAYRAPYNDGDALWYARWNGSEWQKEIVDFDPENDVARSVSLELDSQDRPHISYTTNTMPGCTMLRYAHWNGSEWRIDIIEDTGNVGWSCSLELDSKEYPHIAYQDECFEKLSYASWNGTSWEIETVVSGRGAGFGVSMVMDEDYYPHIAYVQTYPHDEYDVKYAWWGGSEWDFDTVASGHDAMSHISLALDSSMKPHITYNYCIMDTLTFPLMYARRDGESWQVEYLADIFLYSSIVVNSEDQPCICCYSKEPDGLAYLWHEGEFVIEDVELTAVPTDEGVVVGWSLVGDEPEGVRVLRSEGEVEPVLVSNTLPGPAERWLDTEVEAGVEYAYWLEVVEADGTVERFGPSETVKLPCASPELVLYAAYPNPSRDLINFLFSIPADGRVIVSVYDLSGRRIAVPVDSELTAGRHEVAWSCDGVPSGVYLYRLETDRGSLTKRLVVGR
jgi:hypothetical protein